MASGDTISNRTSASSAGVSNGRLFTMKGIEKTSAGRRGRMQGVSNSRRVKQRMGTPSRVAVALQHRHGHSHTRENDARHEGQELPTSRLGLAGSVIRSEWLVPHAVTFHRRPGHLGPLPWEMQEMHEMHEMQEMQVQTPRASSTRPPAR